MKVAVIILTLAFFLPVAAQTSTLPAGRSGKPVSGSYEIKPGNIAEFKYAYGANGRLCSVSVTPSLESPVRVFEQELIESVITSLAPVAKRGKYLMGGFLSIPDHLGSVEDYENVVISKVTVRDEKSSEEFSSVSVRWIKSGCGNKNFWKLPPPPKIKYRGLN